MIGPMRQRITIQAESAASDSQGGYTRSWTTAATVWADVRPVSASEIRSADALDGRVLLRAIVRYTSETAAITSANHRISYDSRTFNITGVQNPDGRKRYLELTLEEGGAN